MRPCDGSKLHGAPPTAWPHHSTKSWLLPKVLIFHSALTDQAAPLGGRCGDSMAPAARLSLPGLMCKFQDYQRIPMELCQRFHIETDRAPHSHKYHPITTVLMKEKKQCWASQFHIVLREISVSTMFCCITTNNKQNLRLQRSQFQTPVPQLQPSSTIDKLASLQSMDWKMSINSLVRAGLRVFCSRNGVVPSRGVIFPGLVFFVPVVFFCSGRCFWCPGICFFCPWNRFECYWNRFFGSPWYFRCPEGFFLCPTEMKCPRVFLVPVSFGNIDFVAWFNEKRFTKQRYGRC